MKGPASYLKEVLSRIPASDVPEYMLNRECDIYRPKYNSVDYLLGFHKVVDRKGVGFGSRS